MRTFRLYRKEDPSGVSGIGYVAEGVVFANGWTIICWTIKPDVPSIVVYSRLEDAIAIHGHEGKTEFQWESRDA